MALKQVWVVLGCSRVVLGFSGVIISGSSWFWMVIEKFWDGTGV